jgi:drug/metabolite transporter (DMT)-like permease
MIIDKGIGFMLIASVVSAFSGLSVKVLTQDISSLESVFFRNLFGLIIILYLLYKNPTSSIKGASLLLFTRGFMGFLGIIAFFYTIETIPLGIAITLNKTSPIFGAIFSFLFIKEELKIHQILALFIGFIGIVFVTKAFSLNIDIDMLVGLFGGFIAGLSYTSIRTLKKYYDTKEIVLSFSIISFIGSLILLLISSFFNIHTMFLQPFVLPNTDLWLWIILLGFSGLASQYFMTKAYEYTKTGIVGTIAYSNIPIAIFLGTLLGDKIPDSITIFGILFIITSGILVSRK